MSKFYKLATIPILLSLVSFVKAQNYHNTFLQYSYGFNYNDYMLGSNPVDGGMSLLTLDQTSVFKYGGIYGFVNYSIASDQFYELGFDNDFETGNKYRLYSEVSPWLSMAGITGKDIKIGPINDISAEASLNLGDGFRAQLYGAGFTFKTPMGSFLKLIAYYRMDNIKVNNAQITGVFDMPILGVDGLRIQGFFDFMPTAQNTFDYGGTDWGPDFLSQTRILLDVGKKTIFKNDPYSKLEIGIDCYMHFNKQMTTFVPQPALRLTI